MQQICIIHIKFVNHNIMNYKKTLFSEISNAIFLIFTIFLLSFLWCNFYFRNFQKSLICSIVFALAFSLIFIPRKIKKHNKEKETTSSISRLNYLKNQLIFSDNRTILDFIIKLYNLENVTYISDNHICVNNEKDIFINYISEDISTGDIYSFYKLSTTNKIEVFCLNTPKYSLKINSKEITFIDFNNFIDKCKKSDYYLDKNIVVQNKPKLRGKELLCIVLGKHRAKSYFGLGLLILFSSIFTPYNIYYIIIASILFILSIFSKFNTIFN